MWFHILYCLPTVAKMGKPYHHQRQCEAWGSYTGLPAILPTKYEWKVDFPPCPQGYWSSGCGQPATTQQATAKCYASSFFPYKIWQAEDSECPAQKQGQRPKLAKKLLEQGQRPKELQQRGQRPRPKELREQGQRPKELRPQGQRPKELRQLGQKLGRGQNP